MNNNIPRVIHYCWFGGRSKPNNIKNCIKSWNEKLDGYEIREWNEENFNIEDIPFAKAAYDNKKWAFVADYCRLQALYSYGGIYLDTDMELLKPLDNLLNETAFGGVERCNDKEHINMAIWGCKKNDKFIGQVLDYYNGINFNDYIDKLDTLAIPLIITQIAIENGYKGANEKTTFFNGTKVFPREFFYPKSHNWEEPILTKNTYTIHHYDGSWKPIHRKYRTKLKSLLVNLFGYERVNKLVEIIKK